MLKYCLIDNQLSKDEKNCVAIVRSEKTINLDEFLNDMVEEGTGLNRPQALAYFEKMTMLTIKYLQKGYFVSTPLFRYRSSISGVFSTKNDSFDPTKHEINITSTAGTRIRNLGSIVTPTKVAVSKTSPEVFYFICSSTDEINSTGISGGSARILGTNLRFDKTDPKQGVFFVSAEDSSIEYRATLYSGIKPSEIHVTIPTFNPGDYKVVIRSLTKKEELISGTLDGVVQFSAM